MDWVLTIKTTHLSQDHSHHFQIIQSLYFIFTVCMYFSVFAYLVFLLSVFGCLQPVHFQSSCSSFSCPSSLLPCCVLCCFVPLCSSWHPWRSQRLVLYTRLLMLRRYRGREVEGRGGGRREKKRKKRADWKGFRVHRYKRIVQKEGRESREE